MSFIKPNKYLLLLIVIFTACAFIVPFQGEFPLNDDWAYSWSVKNYVDTGHFQISDWASPSLVFHLGLGIVFAKLFGFSFFVLRLPVYLMALLGIIFFFLLAEKLSKSSSVSFLFSLILIFNPLFFVYSRSFMTEVPYFSLSVVSLYFYFLGLEKNRYLWIGSIFACCAALTRQWGILIPLGVAVYMYNFDIDYKHKLISVIAVPVIGFAVYLYWFNFIHPATWANSNYVITGTLKYWLNFKDAVPDSAVKAMSIFMYLGLFLYPLGVPYLFSMKIGQNETLKNTVFLSLSFVLFIFVLGAGKFPSLENTLSFTGLGTNTVHNASYKNPWLINELVFWKAVSFIAFVSTIGLLKKAIFDNKSPNKSFFKIQFVIQLAAVLFGSKVFDRYILALLPGAMFYFICSSDIKKPLKAAVFFLPVILFSVIGTLDYFSWNSAKWAAGRKLLDMGYKEGEIANGFDWDGWYTFQGNIEKLKKIKNLNAIGEWEWQSLNQYKAMVSYKYPENTSGKLIFKIPYKSYLCEGECNIYATKLD